MNVLSLATALFTLLAMWLVARKDWRGWLVGLCNQALWLWLIFSAFDVNGGLLPLALALIWIYGRALVVWRREARAVAVPGGLIEVNRRLTRREVDEMRARWEAAYPLERTHLRPECCDLIVQGQPPSPWMCPSCGTVWERIGAMGWVPT